jgi:hypothetical protein
LKRIDVAGGTPIVLCDAQDSDASMTGGSWNRDGVIIFGAPEGIYRVSAAGGVPTLIARSTARLGKRAMGGLSFFPMAIAF